MGTVLLAFGMEEAWGKESPRKRSLSQSFAWTGEASDMSEGVPEEGRIRPGLWTGRRLRK